MKTLLRCTTQFDANIIHLFVRFCAMMSMQSWPDIMELHCCGIYWCGWVLEAQEKVDKLFCHLNQANRVLFPTAAYISWKRHLCAWAWCVFGKGLVPVLMGQQDNRWFDRQTMASFSLRARHNCMSCSTSCTLFASLSISSCDSLSTFFR